MVALATMVGVTLVAVILAGCGGDSGYGGGSDNGGTPAANEVWMDNLAFNPSTRTVTAGTTVTWINKEPVLHAVTSGEPGAPDGKFASGNLQLNGTYSFTFNQAGTYPYYCAFHLAQMQGTIIVQ
jgi:plastocyanin